MVFNLFIWFLILCGIVIFINNIGLWWCFFSVCFIIFLLIIGKVLVVELIMIFVLWRCLGSWVSVIIFVLILLVRVLVCLIVLLVIVIFCGLFWYKCLVINFIVLLVLISSILVLFNLLYMCFVKLIVV